MKIEKDALLKEVHGPTLTVYKYMYTVHVGTTLQCYKIENTLIVVHELISVFNE